MASVRRSLASSEATINTLLSGTAWSGPLGFGFASGFGGNTVTAVNGEMPSAALVGAVTAAFAQIGAFTNLNARWTTAAAADVRVVTAEGLAFAGGQTLPLGAYGFYPGSAAGGDIAFGRSITADLAPGSYGFRTVLHEIGHALGLKHPHEPAPYGALPARYDSVENSVMSVRSVPGASLTAGLGNEPGGFARTYMPADIAALQHLYGANFRDNGNTHYRFDPFERVTLRTIWDGGGHDTYDFSTFVTPLDISLLPGGHSRTGQEPQLNRAQELSASASPIRAEGAIHNAALYRGRAASWIEDAIGGHGSDTITGNGAHNRLEGRSGSDLIHGGTGHDRVFGGTGADTLTGQAGNDRLLGDSGADVLAGGTGDDLLLAAGEPDRLYGGSGNDTLQGGAADDLVDGGGGHDRVHGGPGNDRLFGGSGNDTLAGEAGRDSIIASGGNDILFGGDGDDALFAFDGDDTLSGQNGNDHLDGGRGNDRLNGGAGADRMVGGHGNDVILAEAGNDWLIGGTGTDILGGGDGTDALFGLGGNDTLYGNTGRDHLDGGADRDRIHAGTGDDWMLGGSGNDTLYGEAGNDRLIGGDGDDYLVDGRGIDTLTGGAGRDTFHFSSGGTATDVSSVDRVRLPFGAVLEDARTAGANVVFDLPGPADLILENVSLADLHAGMFI
ncbi:M10 family metallopeptidase [Acuticoccus sp. MNP-M23]|uniref:M10 family metallopeptidase n=1 Tax=Acuticoccus sp. MNP-M23 TaxID=3072793 RepID=UPI002815C4B1|nr:M10 family metallopeptidase [Acuticoccus sp. MNP-M23]WMS40791.1 M10 family metallopeptidase [Acuticoccus sp. MNP-M23]